MIFQARSTELLGRDQKDCANRGHAGAFFDTKVCPRNRVQGLILRHDVPVMQSPLKPLIDPQSWTKTGTIGTESSYMSHVPSFDAISRGSTNNRTWLRQCVENGDTRPQPPKGVGRSCHVFLMRVVLTSISPLAFIAATARCHCFRLASSAPVNSGSTSFRPSLRVNHPAGNSANIS